MEWVLGHMEDADFNDPLPAPAAAAAAPLQASAAAPDPGSVAMLSAMGFTTGQVSFLARSQQKLQGTARWWPAHALAAVLPAPHLQACAAMLNL